MSDAPSVARTLLLRRFRWTKAHADFAEALRDAELLQVLGAALVSAFDDRRVDAVAAVEARGFVLGALAARELNVGLPLVRKPGAVHPDAVREVTIEPDWRGRRLELQMSRRALTPGEKVLLVDDWIETGSQARTVGRVVERLVAHLVGVSVLVDDTQEDVRTSLGGVGLVCSEELPDTPERP